MPYADPEKRRAFQREYMRQRRATSEHQKEYDKQHGKKYRAENWETVRATMYRWRSENRDRWLELKRISSRGHYKRNKPRYRAREALRRILMWNCRLSKLTKADIEAVYIGCPPGYHVDHIVPITNKIVCGLHVPWNLQYLPAKENLSKGNKFDTN